MIKNCSICNANLSDDEYPKSSYPFNNGVCCSKCNQDVNDYRIALNTGLEYPPIIEVVLKTGATIYLYSTRYHYGRINSSRKVLAWDFIHELPENATISFSDRL